MTSQARVRASLVVKFAVSASLVAFLLTRLDTRAILELFSSADAVLLLVGAACLIGQTAIASLKWTILLHGQGTPTPFLEAFRINLISGFINLFAPGTVVGDAYRAVKVRRHTQGIARALPSIIVDRGSGVLALVAIGIVGLTSLYRPEQLTVVAVGLVLSIALGYVLVIGPLAGFTGRQDRTAYFGALGVIDQTITALRPSPRLAAVLALSFVFQLNTVWICWIYSSAIGIDVDLGALLVVVPAAYLVELIPITINGVGLREGTLTVLFGQMGLVPEHGLALGLTISIMRYVAGLVGGALLALDALKPRSA